MKNENGNEKHNIGIGNDYFFNTILLNLSEQLWKLVAVADM
jgi:hypothetical protein